MIGYYHLIREVVIPLKFCISVPDELMERVFVILQNEPYLTRSALIQKALIALCDEYDRDISNQLSILRD